jgi:hypothetical protein
MSPRRLLTLVLVAAGVALAGCESKFNHDNFQMIRTGVDDRSDVRQVLGDPDSEMGDVWLYDDLDRHCSARIFFGDDGRVLDKEWMDAETGDWEGANPWANEPAEGEVRETRTSTRRIDDD